MLASTFVLMALMVPRLSLPMEFHGLLPQRAEVNLSLGGDGDYQLTLKIISRGRAAGAATEKGRWQYDAQGSRIVLSPTDQRRSPHMAQLMGGDHPRAIVALDGYFPDGTTVTLEP